MALIGVVSANAFAKGNAADTQYNLIFHKGYKQELNIMTIPFIRKAGGLGKDKTMRLWF
ncbi:hypothetical protein [Scopulibacillus daqui]